MARPLASQADFARAGLDVGSHIETMGRPHAKFEPVQLKAGAGWFVRVTLPHGAQTQLFQDGSGSTKMD